MLTVNTKVVYKVKAKPWCKQDKMFFLHPDGPALIVQYLELDVLQRFRCVNKAACTAATAEVRAASVSNALAKYQKLEAMHSEHQYIYKIHTPFGKGHFCISQAARYTKHNVSANVPLRLLVGSGCMEGRIVDAYSRTPGALPAKGNHLIRLAENVRLVRVFYDGQPEKFRRPNTLLNVKTVTIDTEMDLRISNEPTRLAAYMVKLEFTAAAKPAERTLFSRS
jgi:hypothetical protein